MVYKIEPGMSIQDLDTPALLVDLDNFKFNLDKMSSFFSPLPAALRPHSKTHKCSQVALHQLAAGAIGITCAKVSEAEVFAAAGIKDILIANQVTGPVKIDRLTELARICDLIVAVDDSVNVDELDIACGEKEVQIRVLVEVDIGMRRCGVSPGQAALDLAKKVSAAPNLKFKGLQAYEGHLVLLQDSKEREEKVRADFIPLKETCDLLEREGLDVEIVSGGGTGTYDISGTIPPLTEIQVGSYVFMDSTYLPIRPEFKSALTVLSTVVSRPVPERLVTDAGLKAMTSEFGWPQLLDVESASMQYLSEEHAVLSLEEPEGVQLLAGEKVRFLPSHVCTTVNLHDAFYVHQKDILVDIWPIAARGCSQ